MGHAGEFEILVMLAVHRLGSDAYGITIRNELEHELGGHQQGGGPQRRMGQLEDGCLRRGGCGHHPAQRRDQLDTHDLGDVEAARGHMGQLKDECLRRRGVGHHPAL